MDIAETGIMSLLDRESVKLLTLQRIIAGDLARFEQEFARAMDEGSPLVRRICRHIQQGRSKRFRPTLLLLAAKGEGEVAADAVTAAACVELIHTATLVHDDFIDGALTRRGQPSINHAWGGPAALIMGDYLYAKALDLLCRAGLHEAVSLLARTTLLMSQAEMLQLEMKHNLATTEQQYLQIIHYKTASLIESACAIGASLHPAGNGHGPSLGVFGRQLGLVFQITDDIFDYLGDARRLGKPTGQDWEEGRVTLPLIAALRQAPAEARASLVDAAQAADAAGLRALWPAVKALVVEHGGIEYAQSMARACGEDAKRALAPVASGAQRELLEIAVDYVVNRLN